MGWDGVQALGLGFWLNWMWTRATDERRHCAMTSRAACLPATARAVRRGGAAAGGQTAPVLGWAALPL